MLFAEKIRQLRDERQMRQREVAAALDIDAATYCKIEKGDRRVKREQVSILSQVFEYDNDELLKTWLADQVCGIVKDEKIAKDVLSLVNENITGYEKRQ